MLFRVCILLIVISWSGFSQNIITVTDKSDNITVPPPGSLREAINTANASVGPDSIVFSSPFNINLAGPLTITDNHVSINGDINDDGYPDVVLNGSAIATVGGGAIIINSSSSTVRSLAIINVTGAGSAGIRLDGASATKNYILGCYLGLNKDGVTSGANSNGVVIAGGANTNYIGLRYDELRTRNLLTGNNSGSGILITDPGSKYNQIRGNFIGLDINEILKGSFS